MKGGRVVPRPLGHQICGTKPKEIIAFDYTFISRVLQGSRHNFVYVFVIKDTYSNFLDFTPCESADAVSAATALINWFCRYGPCYRWISDQGSHFKNKVIAEIARRMSLREHHFTTARCPWPNGSVERANRDLFAVLRLILAELGLPFYEWPYILGKILDILVSAVSATLGGYCPRQMFMNLPPSNPLDTLLLPPLEAITSSSEIS